MTAQRIPPGTAADIGLVNAAIARVLGAVTGTEPPKFVTTLGRHRGLFLRWLVFASGLMPGGRLPRRDSELVILRVAHLTGCAYERAHHEALGRAAGLGDRELAATAQEPPLDTDLSTRQLALLAATDDLHRNRRLGDTAWLALRQHLDDRDAIEFCMLVGNYEMLAMTLNTLGVEPDAPRRGGGGSGKA